MLNMLYGLCYIRPMPRYNIQYMLYDHTLFLRAYARVCACVANILLAFHLHFTSASLPPCAANLSSGNLRIFLIFLRVSRIIMLIYLLCLIYVNMLLALLLLLLLEM